MLFDPKWEKTVKADPLSLDAIIAWLEKQPPKRAYCYMDSGACLAAQYNKSIGRNYSEHQAVVSLDMFERPRFTTFDEVIEWIGCEGERTFGAALERARSLITSRDGSPNSTD